MSTSDQSIDLSEPLFLYDLAPLYSLNLSNPVQAARAHDELHLVSTIQGIVNRTAPRLYVHFVTSNERGSIDIDQYWFNQLRQPGGLLYNRPLIQLKSLDDLLIELSPSLDGAVVWDSVVPATCNVASTIAGAKNLAAFRYDTNQESLYQKYVAGHGPITIKVQEWLVNQDGSSMFTGRGTIPNTGITSTGSAKCDAYIWALVNYLSTGLSMPEFGYFLDGYWITDPKNRLQQAVLTNHDYLVSRKGFFFDLSPWDDETPIDDPNQPMGTDIKTLEEILRCGYERSGGSFFPIHGFIPWGYKYTTGAGPSQHHDPVPTEWRFVQIASAFNGYLDGDAENLDAMANASVFQHVPLKDKYPQRPRPTIDDLKRRGFVDANGKVSPKRYVMFFVGDYDSAAWLYQLLPYTWDDPARGTLPLNWPFNPNHCSRMPQAMVYTRNTATDNDTFICGDSGAGYINPGMLIEPRQFSGLPSGVDAWTKHCQSLYQQWDLTVTGFIIDGNAPKMDQPTLKAYTEFSPDGFAAQKVPDIGIVNETPFVRMGIDLPSGVDEAADALQKVLQEDGKDGRGQPLNKPAFHSIRTITMTPSWHRDVVEMVVGRMPDAAIEIVDAFTFYALVKQHQLVSLDK